VWAEAPCGEVAIIPEPPVILHEVAGSRKAIDSATSRRMTKKVNPREIVNI